MIDPPPWRRPSASRRISRMVAMLVSSTLMVAGITVVRTAASVPAVATTTAATTGPTLQLVGMATAAGSTDRRQYVFALADDRRIWASEQLASGGTQWSDWYAVGNGAFCKQPVTVVNSQGQIEVYGLGCDQAVWRAVQTGSGPGGWSGWSQAGSCCIVSKLALVLDGASRINVFGVGTDGAVYTTRQTAAGSSAWTGWQSLGGYVTSTPIVGIDIYGHPYVYALGGDRNVYFQPQESTGGATFGQWLGWYGIGGGPFIGELGLLAGIVGRRADGRFYVSQKVDKFAHSAWQPLGDGTFISDPVNANSVISGYDYILGGPRWTPATLLALGTDRQVYVNQVCQAGMSCYSYSYWTGWHLAASGTFLMPPIADWSPDFRRLQLLGTGTDQRVYVNTQTTQLNLDAWAGWSLKPGDGIRADCTLSWPAGKVFYPREYYRGCNNELFTWQDNGQIVLYGPDGKVKWTPGVSSIAGSLTIQNDGNMVLYDGLAQRNIWSSNTSTPAPRLSFGHDGNLVLFNDQATRYPVWWSNRNDCRDYDWSPGKVFMPGEYYVSCTGQTLIMQQSDGNLMQIGPGGQIAWATNAAAPGGRLEFQASDGDLVQFNSANQPVWASNQAAPGGSLQFSDDAHLVVSNSSDAPVFAQADQDKEKVRQEIAKMREDLHWDCDASPPQLGHEACEAIRVQLNALEAAINNWQPNQPCTTFGEVTKAILGLTAASGTVAGAATATRAVLIRWAGALAAAALALWGTWRIIVKCSTWHSLQDLLNQANQRVGLLNYPDPTGTDIGFGNWGLAGGPNGQVSAMMSDAFVVGHPEWRVDFGQDPQTSANTVISEIETTRNGVAGTLYNMGNGDTMWKAKGPADMSILYERDNSTGSSTRTIYDEHGNYVITIDSERGLVNVNDGWGGNNPFSAANGGGGWGATGFGGWGSWAGGGGGGTGNCGDPFILCARTA